MLAGLIHRLRLNTQPASLLGDLGGQARAKVSGIASPGQRLLQAPITGRSCVFYSVDIGEWFNGSKTLLLEECSKAIFRIEDSTGQAQIDPTRVQCYLRKQLLVGHSSDYLSEHRAFLKSHGLGMVDEYGELRSLAYRETIIAPGDNIVAMGALRHEADPRGTASYREQPRTPVIYSTSEAVLLSDGRA